MQTQAEFLSLRKHLQQAIVGQTRLMDRLMLGLLTGGHVLLEGAPGLAKTTAVKALAAGVAAGFQRVQFTPDLMPSDITGSDVFDPKSTHFRFDPGPLFHEIILADEINRAPPKVQAALLEAMEERQVTVGGKTHVLPELFMVLATQNPLEQAGTYPLPEAQLDRFLFHVCIDYPSYDEELLILQRDRNTHFGTDQKQEETPLSPALVLQARREAAETHAEPDVERYVVSLVSATRNIGSLIPKWDGYIQTGASPRASIALLRSACALAYINGRDFVTPDDVMEVAVDVLRHRVIPGFKAQADNIDREALLQGILAEVPVP
ncbi:MAG: MoxR family ATPase [Gammaproteobacteria bacterium]|nr:MoxR family ATPase [Gammaproteobacteria bacterium]MDH5802309.1 MoxR family ATPase [Gammaproteobacteria bacterium]